VRVLVREEIADAGVALLRERFDVDVDLRSPLDEIIERYDAIIVRSATQLTAELIERAPSLKVIGRAGVGMDNVDVAAATHRGIVVANAPESTVVFPPDGGFRSGADSTAAHEPARQRRRGAGRHRPGG
jgi:D-3-phosphoglycerate dehydrogenase